MRNDPYEIEPAKLSLEEAHFCLEHLGEPPIAVLHEATMPKGVNPRQIEKTLGIVYECAELERHRKVPWAGLPAVKECLLAYLQWMDVAKEVHRRGGPKHLSMYGIDGSGKIFKYAIGSDSDMVRSAITSSDGARKMLRINLKRPAGELLADWKELFDFTKTAKATVDELVEDWGPDRKGPNGNIRCTICGQATTFRTANRSSYGMARARMMGHLKRARTEVDRHLLLHRRVSS